MSTVNFAQYSTKYPKEKLLLDAATTIQDKSARVG